MESDSIVRSMNLETPRGFTYAYRYNCDSVIAKHAPQNQLQNARRTLYNFHIMIPSSTIQDLGNPIVQFWGNKLF